MRTCKWCGRQTNQIECSECIDLKQQYNDEAFETIILNIAKMRKN